MTKNKAVYSEIGDELNDFNNDNVQFEQSVRGISENDTGRKEKTEQNLTVLWKTAFIRI